jgi:ABC-type Na+ efflux pump permease subunit
MIPRTVLVVAWKDLRRLVNDKAFVFMAASQLILLSLSLTFSSFLPQFASGQAPTPPHFALVAVVGDEAFWSAFPGRDPMFERNELEPALFYFGRGTYDAVVAAPGYGQRVNGTGPLKVDLYLRPGPKRATILLKVKSVLEGLETGARSGRLGIRGGDFVEYRLVDKPLQASSSLVYTVLLPFFVVFLAVIAGNTMITLLSNESEEKTLETLMSCPLTYVDVVVGKSLASLGVVLAQLAVWICVFRLTDVYLAHPLLLFAFACAYVLSFVALGIAAHALAPGRDAAQNVYAALMLPSVVLLLPSGVLPGIGDVALDLVPSRIIAQAALTQTLPPALLAGMAAWLLLSILLIAGAIRLAKARSRY